MLTSLLAALVAVVQAAGPVERAWGVIVAAILCAAAIILLVLRWAFGKLETINEATIRGEVETKQQKQSIDRLNKTVEGLSDKFDEFIDAGAASREKVTNALNTADRRLESVERAAEYIQKMRPLRHGLPNWAEAVQSRIDCLEQESQSPFKGRKWPKLESDP